VQADGKVCKPMKKRQVQTWTDCAALVKRGTCPPKNQDQIGIPPESAKSRRGAEFMNVSVDIPRPEKFASSSLNSNPLTWWMLVEVKWRVNVDRSDPGEWNLR
jgi:hypothetical protein